MGSLARRLSGGRATGQAPDRPVGHDTYASQSRARSKEGVREECRTLTRFARPEGQDSSSKVGLSAGPWELIPNNDRRFSRTHRSAHPGSTLPCNHQPSLDICLSFRLQIHLSPSSSFTDVLGRPRLSCLLPARSVASTFTLPLLVASLCSTAQSLDLRRPVHKTVTCCDLSSSRPPLRLTRLSTDASLCPGRRFSCLRSEGAKPSRCQTPKTTTTSRQHINTRLVSTPSD